MNVLTGAKRVEIYEDARVKMLATWLARNLHRLNRYQQAEEIAKFCLVFGYDQNEVDFWYWKMRERIIDLK